jgi:Bacteriophage HK97-gp10, putative tail-component
LPNAITISGFSEFAGKLKKLPESLQRQVDQVAGFAAATWEQGAKTDAPTDQGRLKNDISSAKIKLGNWQVTVNAEYAPYIEWGTKTRVKVPAGLSVYAAQFKGAGDGKEPKKFIYEWCKRKGIDPKLRYIIYRSIMINGVNPHPFFFIQRPKVERQFIADLRQVLTKLD